MKTPSFDFFEIQLENIHSIDEVCKLITRLREYPEVQFANPFFKEGNIPIASFIDRLFVRLKNPEHLNDLENQVEKLGAKIKEQDEFDPQLYILSITNRKTDALKVANQLYDTNLYDFTEPDFLFILEGEENDKNLEENKIHTPPIQGPISKPIVNDPHFDKQWSLKNNGVNTNKWNGVKDADMRVTKTWVHTGKRPIEIKVAIIDCGVDLNHPDLKSNLAPGFDATGGGSKGAPRGNLRYNVQGTCCAGIVGAIRNNGIGIAGVADCIIVPVRIGSFNRRNKMVTTAGTIKKAFNWAWSKRGGDADVLNCSWNYSPASNAIKNAIDLAVTKGRGGLGVPIFFKVGDDDRNTIKYPSSIPKTIAVIASDMCDKRKSKNSCDKDKSWGSNYGTGADIAAPGAYIYTTDISGSQGFFQRRLYLLQWDCCCLCQCSRRDGPRVKKP
jgi:hypothetical protein